MNARVLFLFMAIFAVPATAGAQGYQKIPTCGTGSPPSGLSPGYMDATGNVCTNSTSTVTGTVTLTPNTGTPTQSAVSCLSSNTSLLAAAAAAKFILVQVPANAGTSVWFNVAGASATAATPNIQLPPGASIVWKSDGFLPTSAINCISTTGTVSVSVTYK